MVRRELTYGCLKKASGEGEEVPEAVKSRLRWFRNHPLREEERETANLGRHTTIDRFASDLVPLTPIFNQGFEIDA